MLLKQLKNKIKNKEAQIGEFLRTPWPKYTGSYKKNGVPPQFKKRSKNATTTTTIQKYWLGHALRARERVCVYKLTIKFQYVVL